MPSRDECYVALGAVHAAYPVIAGRFKDYISTPKANGYQRLHTGVTLRTRATRRSRCRSAPPTCTTWPRTASPPTGCTSRRTPRRNDLQTFRWVQDLLEILDNSQAAGRVPGEHQARAVPGPGLLLHAQGPADPAAARRHQRRLRLCRPQPGRRHLRRRQGQRPPPAADARAAERRPGGGDDHPRRHARRRLGTLRRHRQGPRPHPPLRRGSSSARLPGRRPRRPDQGVPPGRAWTARRRCSTPR